MMPGTDGPELIDRLAIHARGGENRPLHDTIRTVACHRVIGARSRTRKPHSQAGRNTHHG